MELRRPIPARLLASGEGSVGGNAEGLERYLWVALVGVEMAGKWVLIMGQGLGQ